MIIKVRMNPSLALLLQQKFQLQLGNQRWVHWDFFWEPCDVRWQRRIENRRLLSTLIRQAGEGVVRWESYPQCFFFYFICADIEIALSCQISDLASSPLITGDPDSREEKYRRRAPTDWFLRQAAAAATNQHRQLYLLTFAGGGKRWWSLLPRKGEEQ